MDVEERICGCESERGFGFGVKILPPPPENDGLFWLFLMSECRMGNQGMYRLKMKVRA